MREMEIQVVVGECVRACVSVMVCVCVCESTSMDDTRLLERERMGQGQGIPLWIQGSVFIQMSLGMMIRGGVVRVTFFLIFCLS